MADLGRLRLRTTVGFRLGGGGGSEAMRWRRDGLRYGLRGDGLRYGLRGDGLRYGLMG